GIDVAILYRNDHAACIDTTWITIKDETGRTINTRDILIAKFSINEDTLMIAANHWTSKYGGALETETHRISQARILGRFLDSVVTAQPSASIIAGGDLNDLDGSVPLQILKNDFSLHHILPPSGESTYKYQGRWGSVDHVFTAGKLAPENCSAFIPEIPFLLEKDEKYTGERPRRTYRGYAYSGGISDHLPLLLFFQIPN
ncbi:MAG: endonuclease, partial [Bacteroidales bacterium]|nr:endonuclease [Bacteroidales bacterium]